MIKRDDEEDECIIFPNVAAELLKESSHMLRRLSEMYGQGAPALMYEPGLKLAARIDKLLGGGE